MKQANVIASVLLAAAVLLAAYAIGRLVKQARLDVPETPAQRVVEPNDFNDQNIANASRRARPKRQEPTLEERAKAKEERREQLAQRSDMTEEEKEQYRDQMRQRLLSKRKNREPGQIPRLSPEELAGWSDMSDEEKAALRAKIQGRLRRRQRAPRTVTDPNQSSPGGTADQPDGGTKTSDPNTSN
jgi:membrane-associated HD superfamily phosphohydrolase